MKAEYQKYLDMSTEFKKNIPAYPVDTYSGRGVVILAGGERYYTGAWVVVNMLRKWGCTLPVEIWHLGEQEMDDRMREMMLPLGVTTVDAYEVRKLHPARRLYGWECTPFSLLHSRFEEIIFLDADNVPLIDPATLFDTMQYRETGSIFWPDYGRLQASRDIWQICDVPYRDECEFESGQIVVDKKRCWGPLQMSMHLNEHSDFYYKHIHGDKDTFHMAWHMMEQDYSMPSKGIEALRSTMCQHDFEGKRIFQHRNMDKWKLHGGNIKVQGFRFEEDCLAFVRDLRTKWDGRVRHPEPKTPEGRRLKQLVLDQRTFAYHRVNIDKRNLEFLAEGLIGEGSQRCEREWYVRDGDGEKPPELVVLGDGVTFTATHNGFIWKGAWVAHEQMPVELTPVSAPAIDVSDPLRTIKNKLVNRRFIYIRTGVDKRVIALGENGLVAEGSGGLERHWWLKKADKNYILGIGPKLDEPICNLILDKGGVWRGAWTDFEKMPVELVEIPA